MNLDKPQRRRAATAARRSRLPIVLEPGTAEPTATQDCRRCRHVGTCWDPRVEDRHVILNLLVCRIKQRLDENSATRLFLDLVRPKLRKLTEMVYAHTGGAESKAVILQELEGRTIWHVVRDYDIAAIGYPLHYLFGPSGAVMFDARSLTRAIQKRANAEGGSLDVDYDDEARRRGDPKRRRREESYEWRPEDTLDPDPLKARLAAGWRVINDGHTLTGREHRALSLLLSATSFSDTARPIAAVLAYLQRTENIDRKTLGTLIASAEKKVRQAVGEKEATTEEG